MWWRKLERAESFRYNRRREFLDGAGTIRFKFPKQLGLKMFLILQAAKAKGF